MNLVSRERCQQSTAQTLNKTPPNGVWRRLFYTCQTREPLQTQGKPPLSPTKRPNRQFLTPIVCEFLDSQAFNGSGSRQDFRPRGLPQLLPSSATNKFTTYRRGTQGYRLIYFALGKCRSQGSVHACDPVDIAALKFDGVFLEVDADDLPLDRPNFKLGADRQLVRLALGS